MSHLLCRIVRKKTAQVLGELKEDERLDFDTRTKLRTLWEQNIFVEARIEEDMHQMQMELMGGGRTTYKKYPD